MKRKPVPRSLFRKRRPTITKVAGDDIEGIKRLFAAVVPPERILNDNLAMFEAAAEKAAADDRLQRGKEYARDIRRGVVDLRQAMKSGDVTMTALKAMRLVEVWMELRADAISAKHVRDAQRRQKNRRYKKLVTDRQIRAALKACPTYRAAALKLGISERHLRERRKKL